MKKIILSVVALMAIGTLNAQKVTILSGSNDFMKESDALASFDVDLSDCVVVDFGTGNSKVRKELGTLEEYLDANGKEKTNTPTPKVAVILMLQQHSSTEPIKKAYTF